ncbi:MAG: histidine--tRNA ligase [Polyangiales bacterium]
MGTLQAVTGMNDVLPGGGDTRRWLRLEAAFRDVCARYGYAEVRTPICEYAELFHRGVGEATDIVEKEMYTFEDRGGRKLSLRPEGTASAVRAAIEHAALAQQPVVRWAYLGPMFRAEKPAKGRYRQFHQVGAEVYGDPSPAADAECIDLAATFIRSLGVGPVSVRLNSLGGADTRRRYRDALVAYFTPLADRLSEESRARLARNPLRILDSKDPRDLPHKAGAPSILDALDDADREHFEQVKAFLTATGVPFTVDPTLVRGLDYYTRTVFEVVDVSGALGAQDALGAGGRYDALFTELGSAQPVPAFGFALGVERLLLAAPDAPEPQRFTVSVVAAAKAGDTPVLAAALGLAKELREAGVETLVDTRFVSMKSQMRRASDAASRYVLILGGDEVAKGEVTLKDLASGEQTRASRAEVIARLRAESSAQGSAPR